MAMVYDASSARQERNDGVPMAAHSLGGSADGGQYLRTVPAKSLGAIEEKEVNEQCETDQSITPGSSGFTTPDEFPRIAATSVSVENLADRLQKLPNARTRRSNDESSRARSSFDSMLRQAGSAVDSVPLPLVIDATSSAEGKQLIIPEDRALRHIGRKSWYNKTFQTVSRSPSPSKIESPIPQCPPPPEHTPSPPPPGHIRKKSLVRRRDANKLVKKAKAQMHATGLGDFRKSPVRESNMSKRRSVGGILHFSNNSATQPAHLVIGTAPAIPFTASAEKLQTFWSSPISIQHLAPPERPRSRSRSPVRKKGELWSVFRSLEADLARFSTKLSVLKPEGVRSALLPFLDSYATHSSNDNIPPEDLEWRANVLDKWWNASLDLLNGRDGFCVSGTDRPVVLKGIEGIMQRPEWRQAPSPFSPLSARKRDEAVPSLERSTVSFASSSSDFIADSIHHHVRTMFVRNLTAQVTFVVGKMSLRNVPASLVQFSGETCAYAFICVPGVADILTQLWNPPKDTIRRVLDEQGIGKHDSIPSALSGPIIRNFPTALHQLGFTSLAKLTRALRTPPPLPPTLANIGWWGPWCERWRGRESDLFYSFVKHYYLLCSDFSPPDASQLEWICMPGLVLVQSQILVNIDATIHRCASPVVRETNNSMTSSMTFDDLLADPDAVASPFPSILNSAVRVMAENRLMMLVREFLSCRTTHSTLVRTIFARSINSLLQAAAKKVSLYDHSACSTLLDFLEEALSLLARYEDLRELDESLIDHAFWLVVYKRMISSGNTATEIRLYSYLYTTWSTLTPDWKKKQALCLDLLLEQSIFQSRFNHWSPMVRAYFMRLLCWRVLRYDGDEGCDDVQTFATMRERLQDNWTQLLRLRELAEQRKEFFPSSAPCNAAPGRRFLIIKTDQYVAPDASLLCSDVTGRSINAKRTATTAGGNVAPGDIHSESDDESESLAKGISGFFRRMMKVPPSTQDYSSASNSASEPVEVETAASDVADPAAERAPAPVHRSFSFRFSLEPQHNHHNHHRHNHTHTHMHNSSSRQKRLSGNPPMRLQPPRLPPAAEALLRRHAETTEAVSRISVPATDLSPEAGRYCGRALAEWTLVIGECHSFFERRRNEGVQCDRLVETPTLGMETIRRH